MGQRHPGKDSGSMKPFEKFDTQPIERFSAKELSPAESMELRELDAKLSPSETTRLPRNIGRFTGEVGNSNFIPNPEYIPPEKSRNPDKPYSNPDHLSLTEIFEKYGIKELPFCNGFADFSGVSRGEVSIDHFTDDRDANFAQADEKMAEQRGCTPEEVAAWRKENGCTWHECPDCRTMQKVPHEIHANIPHEGGISVYKANHEKV